MPLWSWQSLHSFSCKHFSSTCYVVLSIDLHNLSCNFWVKSIEWATKHMIVSRIPYLIIYIEFDLSCNRKNNCGLVFFSFSIFYLYLHMTKKFKVSVQNSCLNCSKFPLVHAFVALNTTLWYDRRWFIPIKPCFYILKQMKTRVHHVKTVSFSN